MAAAFCAGVAAIALCLRQEGGARIPLFLFGLLGMLGSIGAFKVLRAGTLPGATHAKRFHQIAGAAARSSGQFNEQDRSSLAAMPRVRSLLREATHD
jgi:hypothetical protein